MLAPPRPPARGPVLRRRALARGSLVGVGMLALTASGIPAAFADDEAVAPGTPAPEAGLAPVGESAPEVLNPAVKEVDAARPVATIEGFFGSGKSVGFQVEYDEATAPSGLDLSGAVFTLTGEAGVYTCTTDATGFCSVESNALNGFVPAGDYTVTQTDHSVGLTAATGAGSVHLCNWLESLDRDCGYDSFDPVVNDSIFRSPVVTSVEDAVTGAPIEGAVYTLTGPGFDYAPNEDESSGDEGTGDEGTGDEGTVLVEAQRISKESVADDVPALESPLLQEVRATSAADGSLTFTGWFLPGTAYVLAPVSSVDGYVADTETTGIEIAPSTGVLRVSLDPRLLRPIAIPAPVVPGGDTPAVTPAPVPAPAATPAGAGAPAVSRPGRVAAPAPAAPAEPIAAEPATPSASSATKTFDHRSGAGEPATPPQARGVTSPAITTVSSNLPDKGLLMALGVLFLIVVVVAAGLVRRHARRRA
ncbi:MAG: hypothetical protein JWQ37_3105 [Blastococcus sp.]|nr:hypothetical protein [Blastococcus sp.]